MTRKVRITSLGAGAAIAALVLVPATAFARAGAERAASSAKAPKAFRAVLPIPSPGDVTYGIAQVRIAKGVKAAPGGPARVVKASVAGLKVTGRSANWKKLGKAGRIHVAASKVEGGKADVRNIVFFITHKKSKGARPVRGNLEFTVGNATANVGSFYVRKVDARGTATIFQVKDIVASAVKNWERYLAVLGVARALTAAHNAVDVNGRFDRPAGRAVASAAKLALGGDKMTPAGRKVFDLIFGTIKDPLAYQAAKKSPIAPAFITTELGNPELAKRWVDAAAKLPLMVPDAYAAAAKQEAQFAKIVKPKIARTSVVMAEGSNSTTRAAKEIPPGAVTGPQETIVVKVVGPGNVEAANGINCPKAACSAKFTSGQSTMFAAFMLPQTRFKGWVGCDRPNGLACFMDTKVTESGSTRTLTATFEAEPGVTHNVLSVATTGDGLGSVTGQSSKIKCPSACEETFVTGSTTTLTATPVGGTDVSAWDGCDTHTATTCTVKVDRDRKVTVTFARHVYRFLSDIGGFGGPAGVHAVGGELWVADTANNKVLRQKADGTPISSWGTFGSVNGQFSGPRQVAPSLVGVWVYVSDSYNHRVQRFDTSGAHQGNFASTFNTPRGIAVDPTEGFVAVADTYSNTIAAFDTSGALLRNWTSPKLNTPTGLAVDATGNVIVANWGAGTVEAFTAEGTHLGTVAAHGGAVDQVDRVVTVSIDHDTGDLFMGDEAGGVVHRYR